MQFARVVDAYEKIEATTKRLEMTDLLVGLLRETPKEDLDKVVYLTQGRIRPDYEGVELGLAEKMVMRVLAQATGLDDVRIARSWKEKGDLGLVAEQAISSRRQKPLESTPLTTDKVYDHLAAIAREAGEGSQDRKIRLLSDLLGNATPREAKYIVRMVVGQMRLGVADMTIVDALAATFATKAVRARVERAYNVSSDLGEVARMLASKGVDGLDEIHLKLFRPIRAMLAERLETLEQIFARMGKAALEYKYDGLRVQAHVSPKRIELFSRHLENTTEQFPEIVHGLKGTIRERGAIIEGEAVPVDPNTGEFLPFQEVSRRRGRKIEVERMAKEFPVTLFAFDCPLRGDEDLTSRPYTERRKALEGLLQPNDSIRLATMRVSDDVRQAALPERLAPHIVPHRSARVDSKLEADAWFEPSVVLEVLGAEITLSPVHTAGQDLVRSGAGLAIRFPRFTGKWREDKGAEDATTVQEITEMYERQQKVAKKGVTR